MLRREPCRARMLVDMTTERQPEHHEELRVPATLATVLVRFGALVATVVACSELVWVAAFARDVVVGLGQDPMPSGTFVFDVLWAAAVFAVVLAPPIAALWCAWMAVRRRSGSRVLAALVAVGGWPLVLLLPPVWALGWLVA